MSTLNRSEVQKLPPAKVHETLGRTMLADGFEQVVDLRNSQGSYMVDQRDGRKYLDFFSFFASAPLGFNHPKMLGAEAQQRLLDAALHNPSNSDLYTVPMAQFVATFERVAMPRAFKYLFFIAGGALAVENALKTAFDWKIRKNFRRGIKEERGTKVLHFRQAFHGRTGYTLSLTNTADPRKTQYFPKFDWPRIENPKCFFPLEGDNLKRTVEAEGRAIAQLKEAIRLHGDDIAALIIEPIQGEGGDNHFRGEFLRALKELSLEGDFLLVFDEVQTGLGLTGKMWCFEHFDMAPDILAFGKKTQVCGIMAGPRVDEEPENVFKVASRINSTWGGNLVDMARCQLYLEIIEEEKLVQNAARQGERLLGGVREVAAERPDLLSNVRGRGLMIAYDLPSPELRGRMLAALAQHGLLALPSGVQSVRYRPALNVGAEEVQASLEILRKSLWSNR